MKFKRNSKNISKKDEAFVYARIGMALISAQRVEYITGQLLEHLAEFDNELYNITAEDFLYQKGLKKPKKTLGQIFKLLKLKPEFMIDSVLNDYSKRRNIIIHNFWVSHLNTKSVEQVTKAITFCNEFGKFSDVLESFFKGFLYNLSMYHTNKHRQDLNIESWEKDYRFFKIVLEQKDFIQENNDEK